MPSPGRRSRCVVFDTGGRWWLAPGVGRPPGDGRQIAVSLGVRGAGSSGRDGVPRPREWGRGAVARPAGRARSLLPVGRHGPVLGGMELQVGSPACHTGAPHLQQRTPGNARAHVIEVGPQLFKQ